MNRQRLPWQRIDGREFSANTHLHLYFSSSIVRDMIIVCIFCSENVFSTGRIILQRWLLARSSPMQFFMRASFVPSLQTNFDQGPPRRCIVRQIKNRSGKCISAISPINPLHNICTSDFARIAFLHLVRPTAF